MAHHSVAASPDGTTFTQANQVSMNGYRLTAWFTPMEMRYITLAITPAAPDTLGGTSYTFGLTDFAGTETEFELVSELVTAPISFTPASLQLKLVAPSDPKIFGLAATLQAASFSCRRMPIRTLSV